MISSFLVQELRSVPHNRILACGSMVLSVLCVFGFCALRAQKPNHKKKLKYSCEQSRLDSYWFVYFGLILIYLITFNKYVVVPSDSRAQTFDDLRGQLLAYNEPHSLSGYQVVRAHLASQGDRHSEEHMS